MLDVNIRDFDAVIFDLDGTMVDNIDYHIEAWIALCRAHGIDLSVSEYNKNLSGKSTPETIRLIFGSSISQTELEKLSNEKESYYRQIYTPHIAEIKGLSTFLKKLRSLGLKLAVATTAPKANRDLILPTLGIDHYFDIIIGEEHAKKGKPDPEIYLVTATHLGVNPKKCLVFEDTPAGIKAAKGALMTVVSLKTTHSISQLSEADFLIDDYTQIHITD